MRHQARRWFVILLAIIISMRIPAWQSQACCTVFRHDAKVQIADQKILIAWDPTTQMEHFVREAGFQRPALDRNRIREAGPEDAPQRDDDFGFLVPSPTQPVVEASDGLVFSRLGDAIVPKVTFKTHWHVMPIIGILAPFLLLNSRSPMEVNSRVNSAVDVLESKRVAGYDVSVLRADDATALTQWLSDNGYDARAGLKEWAQPYVANGWIITAFKYSSQSSQQKEASQQKEGSQQVEASAIRISFKTDRPIFPYRVPTDQITEPGKGHLLRTFVIGPARASGTLGDLTDAGTVANTAPYAQGRMRYSMPLRGQQYKELLTGVIPDQDLAVYEQSWLTAFDDHTWPSSTQDLWFDFDPQAQPYQETRVVTDQRAIMLPLDLVALLGVLVIRRRRKAKSEKPRAKSHEIE